MEKVNNLKKFFINEKIDGYFIPKNDEFFGEYTPNHNDRLKFITDFTGSYGFAIILKKKNYLFVDGRYTLQAQKQSSKKFKIKSIPNELPKKILRKNLRIGYDPNLSTKNTIRILFGSKCKLIPINNNLVDRIWKRKNNYKIFQFYNLPRKSTGKSYNQKINQVSLSMKKHSADLLFVTAGENVAWLLNIRGKDSAYAPIPNCYALIEKNKKIKLFCDLRKISKSLRNNFKKVEFIKLELLAPILLHLKDKKIIVDKASCSIFFENIILKNNKILKYQDPIYKFKSIKSKIEIDNTIYSHIFDGAALTKFLFWLKKNFIKKKITEIDAEKKLLNFRKKYKTFKYSSFPTISGTGPNGAIIHYRANKKSNLRLKKGDIYLVDSGGQYNFGTTDVTRTISLYNKSNRIKNIFTRVLKGHIAVASYQLDKKTCGAKIDKEARKYLNQINLDYAHGTGHGVGYFLNVHEGPQSISKNNKTNFQSGMIVSNEPGYYEKNKFGIRIENLIYVKKYKSKYVFDNLTMVPIDKSLINQSILSKSEKSWLNKYHNKVFKNLRNFMDKVELPELQKACSAI